MEKKVILLAGSLFILLFGMLYLQIGSSAIVAEDQFEENDTKETAARLSNEGTYRNLCQKDDDWYIIDIPENNMFEVAIYFNSVENNMSLFIFAKNGTLLNSSTSLTESREYCEFRFEAEEPAYQGSVYILITGDNNEVAYDMVVNIFTYGDNSGFSISDEYVEKGMAPNTIPLLITYLAMIAVITLWINFGFSFIGRGIKSENQAQKTYYKGLGIFILTVALSESSYLFDLFSRDVSERRIFLEAQEYPDPFYSFIEVDYYTVSFIMVLLGLAVLMNPMEKYLYSHKKQYFTYTIAACVPLPIIIRLIEMNHAKLGLELDDNGSFDYQMVSLVWIAMVFVAAMALLYLLKLYIDLGSKSPKGSILRRKSRYIMFGLVIWLLAIFSTSSIIKEVSKVDSDFGPYAAAAAEGSWVAIVQSINIYPLFPFLIPIALLISLQLLVAGFTRDY